MSDHDHIMVIEAFDDDPVATAFRAVAARARGDYDFRCAYGADPLAEVVSVDGDKVTMRLTRR